MKKVTFRYLSQEDVLKVKLPYRDIIEVVEAAMAAKGLGEFECPPKPGVHTRTTSTGATTFLHAMPAFVKTLDVSGLKWVAGYPDNFKYDLPQIFGLMVLNDCETGAPLSVMDCRWITGVRTAAVSAVTAKYCRPAVVDTLSIVGAGMQARTHAIMLKEVCPEIKRILISDIKPENVDKCIADLKPFLPDVEFVPVSTEDAIKQADILVTATQRVAKPFVFYDMIKPGALVMALEAGRALEGKLIKNCDKYITDDWDLTLSYVSQGAFAEGLPAVHNTLGKIVIGEEPGRERAEDIILAVNEGMAISDVALAAKVYEAAMEKGIGIDLPLMEQENIL